MIEHNSWIVVCGAGGSETTVKTFGSLEEAVRWMLSGAAYTSDVVLAFTLDPIKAVGNLGRSASCVICGS